MRIIRFRDVPKEPASHENPRDPAVLKKILFHKDDLAVGRIQMINWATLAPSRTFKVHFHEDMDEIFIILNGKAMIHVGEEKALLEKGDAMVISQQTIHAMTNVGNTPVNYIVIGISREKGGKTVTKY